jgi:hypothetical protein
MGNILVWTQIYNTTPLHVVSNESILLQLFQSILSQERISSSFLFIVSQRSLEQLHAQLSNLIYCCSTRRIPIVARVY